MTTELSPPASRALAGLGQAPTSRPSQAAGFGAALDTAQAALVQPVPAQPVAAPALPGQALPAQALSGQALPAQALPGQALPAQALPGQALPGQALPGQALPGSATPAAKPAATGTLPPVSLPAPVTLPAGAQPPAATGSVAIPVEPAPTPAGGIAPLKAIGTPAQHAALAEQPVQPGDIEPDPARMPPMLQGPVLQGPPARSATLVRADQADDVEETEATPEPAAASAQPNPSAPLPTATPVPTPLPSPQLPPLAGDAVATQGTARPADGQAAPIATEDASGTPGQPEAMATTARPDGSPHAAAPISLAPISLAPTPLAPTPLAPAPLAPGAATPGVPAPDALPATPAEPASGTAAWVSGQNPSEGQQTSTQGVQGEATATPRADTTPLPVIPDGRIPDGGMAAPANNAPAAPALQPPPATPMAATPMAATPMAAAPPVAVPPRFYAMPDPAAPAQQLGPILAAHASQRGGMSRLMVTLRPAELGAVEIAVESMADGPAQIRILAERPETLQLLQRDRVALEQALQRAGVEPSANGLTFGLSDPGSRDGGAPSGQGPSSQAQDGRGQGQRDTPRNPWRQAGPGQDAAGLPIALPGRHARGLLDLAL